MLLLRRAIDALREIACDERAAEHDRSRYARSLVAIAGLASHHALALGMATTALEQRVSLLRAPAPRKRSARTAAAAFAALLIVVIAAGCRYRLSPAVGDRPSLAGSWELDAAASSFGSAPHYSAFDQQITQRGNSLSVEQRRVFGNSVRRVTWSIVTDGVDRPLVGDKAHGSAQWQNERLLLDMRGPGAHREVANAYLTADGRMVCDGRISGPHPGNYRIVFRRTR